VYISHGNVIQLGEEKKLIISAITRVLNFFGGRKRMHFFTEENFPYVLISVSRQGVKPNSSGYF
jgi:hypothetical protein